MSPQELNKCLEKLYLTARQRDGFSIIYAPKLSSLTAINELKVIIFVFNYLTVLEYTRTIISRACFSNARLLKCSRFFFLSDLVFRSRVPSEDRGNWG